MPLTFAETPLYYKDSQGQYHRVLSGADMTGYRTATAQDAVDAAQDAEIGIVITGKRPSMAVTAGQFVIVRNSTISGITDGLYTANAALSPSTDVTAANLSAVSIGGLNNINKLLTYKAGDSITFVRIPVIGRMVNAKNGVYLGIQVDRPILATSAVLTLGNTNNFYPTSEGLLESLGNSGYTAATIIDTANPISHNEIGGNSVWFIVPLKTTLSYTGTVPVTAFCELANAHITFS